MELLDALEVYICIVLDVKYPSCFLIWLSANENNSRMSVEIIDRIFSLLEISETIYRLKRISLDSFLSLADSSVLLS